MFICGNDDVAKKAVSGILAQFGWETADMGKVEAARAIEPLCMLWCIPGFLRNDWFHAFQVAAYRSICQQKGKTHPHEYSSSAGVAQLAAELGEIDAVFGGFSRAQENDRNIVVVAGAQVPGSSSMLISVRRAPNSFSNGAICALASSQRWQPGRE